MPGLRTTILIVLAVVVGWELVVQRYALDYRWIMVIAYLLILAFFVYARGDWPKYSLGPAVAMHTLRICLSEPIRPCMRKLLMQKVLWHRPLTSANHTKNWSEVSQSPCLVS